MACSAGYASFEVTTLQYVCAKSSMLEAGGFTESANFFLNCKYFARKDNGDLVCTECSTGFLLTTTDKCVANSLANCKIATSVTVCAECKDDFELKSGACVVGAISNCLVYLKDQAAQTCTRCKDKFFLESNKCSIGGLENCEWYDTIKKCKQCASGSYQVNIGNDRTVCFLLDKSIPCPGFDLNKLNQGVIECTRCNEELVSLNSDTIARPVNHCNDFPTLKHCQRYNSAGALSAVTLACLECSSNYFVNTHGFCQTREYADANCSLFKLDGDLCSTCKDGHFLDGASKKCLPNPTGISGCRTYRDATTCLACREGSYLNQNLCIELTTATTVKDCKYYEKASICTECTSAFALVSNKCEIGLAKNCLTYDTPTVCKTCAATHSFVQQKGGQVDCEEIPDLNCLVFENNPYKCTTCKSHFYLDT